MSCFHQSLSTGEARSELYFPGQGIAVRASEFQHSAMNHITKYLAADLAGQHINDSGYEVNSRG